MSFLTQKLTLKIHFFAFLRDCTSFVKFVIYASRLSINFLFVLAAFIILLPFVTSALILSELHISAFLKHTMASLSSFVTGFCEIDFLAFDFFNITENGVNFFTLKFAFCGFLLLFQIFFISGGCT